MQKRFLAVVLMFAAMSSSAWAECGKLCDENWWQTATASDVQAELDAGVDVNASNKWGHTPLHLAASQGTAEGVQLLIAAGADITAKVWDAAQKNEKLEGTETLWSLAEALGKCSRWCDADWWKQTTAADVQAELDAGADVNARDKDGYTPLHKAGAGWGDTEKVQLLIAAGADVMARDEKGYTPLHWAKTAESIQLLIAAGADVMARTERGTTPLHLAAINGTAETIEALIAAGADVMARSENGFTPLHLAAEVGTAESIQLLIAAGADVMARTEGGTTPIIIAAKYGTAETIEALIAAGVDVNARTEGGITPLHWAAQEGNAETIEALIAAGADVSARTEDSNYGATPLHLAALQSTAEGVQLLIAAGADITVKDDLGRSVWDLVQKNEKLAGTEALWSLAEALGKCSRWCDVLWWQQTTAADLQALLDAGVYNKLSDEDRATAWNLAKSSPLKGSAAYWALNDARFK